MLDEQCETFVICNDGTMIVIWMLVVYIYVGYGCYMELCVGYVLAMYVYLICEIVT